MALGGGMSFSDGCLMRDALQKVDDEDGPWLAMVMVDPVMCGTPGEVVGSYGARCIELSFIIAGQ